MDDAGELLEHDALTQSCASDQVEVIARYEDGHELLRICVADASALRHRSREYSVQRETRDPTEPNALRQLPDYSPVSQTLSLIPIGSSAELDQATTDWSGNVFCASLRESLGARVRIAGGGAKIIGRVSAIEAAFWLQVGEGVTIPYTGGLEISLDLDEEVGLGAGTPLVNEVGALVGIVVAVGSEAAIAAPIEPLIRENRLALASQSDILEHNAAARATSLRGVSDRPFGDTIRGFGRRLMSNPAFYSRAVSA